MATPRSPGGRANLENMKQPKYGYARARSQLQPETQPRTQVRVPKAANTGSYTKRMRFLSKADKGWSWLSVQMRDVASEVKLGMARKGELPPELVQALWGGRGLKTCCKGTEAVVGHFDKKLEKAEPQQGDTRVRRSKAQKRSPSTLMDVLLENWTYFDHSHADVHRVDKHVHAKYCEKAFGHFLLPDGRQVHGSYSVPLSYLMQQLRKLLAQLRSKIVSTQYKEVPAFVTPKQEVLPEFEPPVMKPLPQLYPIEGLLPVPTEESEGIEPELPAPVFEAPVAKEMPPLELPPPIRVPPLKLPPQPLLLEDENSIDKSLYKEDPLPVFHPPERLPLPEFQEPKLQSFPPEPVPVKAAVLPMPVEESAPPFVPPEPDPKPCERSFYHVQDDSSCLCEGQCMTNLDKYARKAKPCQAKPIPLLPVPPPPYPLPLVPKAKPEFVPPEAEPPPKYQPPALNEKPVYVPPPPLVLPPWRPPPSPDPIGWLGGQRPIFLVDCSGTMARGGMKMAHDVLRTIFSPGGQVDVAATHFDIIMYSFDAWSFGAMENYRMSKQNRFWRPEEVMQEKSAASLEAAYHWASRWGAGGSTNLLKALDVALNRPFCDCIYLLTDGKPDKPILVLQQIKQFLKLHGHVTPIYTVGLATTRYGERFLQRISGATGGKMRHVDSDWARKPAPLSGPELEDTLWARQLIQDRQRRNLEEGRVESVESMEERVRARFEKERHLPRIAAYESRVREAEAEYAAVVRTIEDENERLVAEAKEKCAQACEEVLERNRLVFELAEEQWRKEAARVEEENQRAAEAVERWKLEVKHIEEENERTVEEARRAFVGSVKEVEAMNEAKLRRAREEYEAEVQGKRAAYEAAVRETERQQEELEETVAMRNKAIRDNYDKTVAEIVAANTAASEKAAAEFAARAEYVESENARVKKEAEDGFGAEYEKVRLENARRVAALQQRVAEMRSKKAAAMEAYKAEVAKAMAEHEEQSKALAAVNKESEDAAKRSWRSACEVVAAENLEAAKLAVEAFERQSTTVHAANMRRAATLAALAKKKLEVESGNEEVTRKRRAEWKAECEAAQAEYEEAVAAAKSEHERVCAEMERRNAETFQAACVEHKAKVAAAEAYNNTVRPLVEASVQVKAEIARVEKFIRYVASACLGPGEQWDKTSSEQLNALAKSQQGMETKLLIEALQEAYGSRRPDGGYFDRPSFYAGKGFSGMIPIHPARVLEHHCADLDDHVKQAADKLAQQQAEMVLQLEQQQEQQRKQPRRERPRFRM